MHTHLENLDSLQLSGNFLKCGEVREFRYRSGNIGSSHGIFILELIVCFQTDILSHISGLPRFQRQFLPEKSCYVDLDCHEMVLESMELSENFILQNEWALCFNVNRI